MEQPGLPVESETFCSTSHTPLGWVNSLDGRILYILILILREKKKNKTKVNKPKSSSKIELIFQLIRSQTGYHYYDFPLCSSGKKIVLCIKSSIIYLGAQL